ncbi:MAG: RidA family protein [Rhodospirillaceae bacterium]
MTIDRYHGNARGRARATRHAGLVYAVATDPSNAASVAEQTRNTLAALDKSLAEAGSDKTRIVQATVYLTDVSAKDEMDAVWCEWIGPEANWPQRACIGVQLAGANLVEIVLIAAAK